MYHNAEQRRKSIQACWDARNECQETLYNRCLEMGGRHVEERHVKLMLDTIAICQITADFMTRHSSMYEAICNACAEICVACAESCEAIDGAEMTRCAETCRKCAAICIDYAKDPKSIAA